MLAKQNIDSTENNYNDAAQKFYNSSTRLPKSIQTVRSQSKIVSNPENFQKMKKFMEDDHIRCCKLLDRATAREMKTTTDQVKAKRDKALEKQKKLMATGNIVYMSDEMDLSDGESTS